MNQNTKKGKAFKTEIKQKEKLIQRLKDSTLLLNREYSKPEDRDFAVNFYNSMLRNLSNLSKEDIDKMIGDINFSPISGYF